ncbi:hypothetical protein C4D60_Mb04t15560 [Musa balbisiana]|uniref:Uncharacterized protein n=1 Tax=Musa balbisiana TaxID=52838 RepID=A0A4S8KCA2_MUSBA|nr:hypothetical protein C4D60_Mb04t15560 [Musa balbisiana]
MECQCQRLVFFRAKVSVTPTSLLLSGGVCGASVDAEREREIYEEMQVLQMGNASTTGDWMGVRSVATNGEDHERHGSVFKSMIAAAQVDKWSSTSSLILCIPLFMHDRLWWKNNRPPLFMHERNNRPPLFMHERKCVSSLVEEQSKATGE